MSGLLERQQRQVNNLLETLYIEIQSQIIPNITIDNLDRLSFPSKTNRLVVGTEFTFTFPRISSRLLLVSILLSVLPDGQGQKIPRFGRKDTNST